MKDRTGPGKAASGSTRHILEWVDDYLSRGWSLLPLYSIEFGHCTCYRGRQCKSPGKHPRIHDGSKGATTDLRRIRSWIGNDPHINLGISTGGTAALVVLDVDPRHQGDRSLAHLEGREGALPRTYTVRTGGGGWHWA